MAYNSFSCVSQTLPQYHVLSWGRFLRQFEYELPLRVKCLVPTLVALFAREFCKLKRWNLHRKTGHRVISRGHLFVEPFLSGSPVSRLQWCEQHPHGSVAMTFYLSTDRRVFCRQQRLFWSVVPYACLLDCSGRFNVLWPPCSPFQQCRHLLIATVCSQS